MKAIWNNQILAESDETIVVEGNHYFPKHSLNEVYFTPSQHHTICSWKGEASYYHLEVDGMSNLNAAWYYPQPKEEANKIKNYVAFWKGVKVTP